MKTHDDVVAIVIRCRPWNFAAERERSAHKSSIIAKTRLAFMGHP